MKITKGDFQDAAAKHAVPEETIELIWQDLESNSAAGFNVPNLAYYLGSLIIISAMSWFLTQAWDDASGLAMAGLGLVYFFVFALAGHLIFKRKDLRTLGGLLLTIAVSVVPLAVFGFEKATGLWPGGYEFKHTDYHAWVRNSWVVMEAITVLVGSLYVYRYRFPFLTFPVAFALWYLSMDLTPLLFGQSEFNWEQRQWVSVVFGLAMMIVSYLVDRKTDGKIAFWGYLFGLMAFWGGMTSMEGETELNRLLYCVINLFLLLTSVVIQRKVFAVFGSLGVFGYLAYLSWEVFEDSYVFPIVLSLMGIGIICLGLLYFRHHKAIEGKLRAIFPGFVKELKPHNRGEE